MSFTLAELCRLQRGGVCLFSSYNPTSSRVGAPNNLRERTMKLLSEMTGVSVENVANVQGQSS